jgi:hypothetical protein
VWDHEKSWLLVFCAALWFAKTIYAREKLPQAPAAVDFRPLLIPHFRRCGLHCR